METADSFEIFLLQFTGRTESIKSKVIKCDEVFYMEHILLTEVPGDWLFFYPYLSFVCYAFNFVLGE